MRWSQRTLGNRDAIAHHVRSTIWPAKADSLSQFAWGDAATHALPYVTKSDTSVTLYLAAYTSLRDLTVINESTFYNTYALRAEASDNVTGTLVANVEAQALDAVADAQALIGFCTPDLLAKGDALHWVQVYSSGVERCVVLPQMRTGDKLLTNGQRIGSPALAEHAIAMMMALARGFDRYYVNQLEGDWQRQVDLGQGEFLELGGRTVLIVGLGGIGTQVARRAYGPRPHHPEHTGAERQASARVRMARLFRLHRSPCFYLEVLFTRHGR